MSTEDTGPKPISAAQAAAEAANAPAFKPMDEKDGPEDEGVQAQSTVEAAKEQKPGAAGAAATDKDPAAKPGAEAVKDPAEAQKEQAAQAKQEQTELPAEVRSQFPDADFSKTTVVLNSAEAAKRGVEGFAQGDVIQVAPNVPDVKRVLRHEAAHIAQQAKLAKGEKEGEGGGGAGGAAGGGAAAGAEKDAGAAGDAAGGAGAEAAGPEGAGPAEGGAAGPQAGAATAKTAAAAGPANTAQLETEAKAAESGAAPKELSAAGPAALNLERENMGPDNAEASSPQGVPKVTLGIGPGGIVLDSVSGQFSKDIVKAKWDPKKLAEARFLYRIPAFPVAGVYVAAGATFTPEAKVSASAQYQWKPADRKFSVTGSITGSISGALTGYVEGGAALDAVIQRGGVGLRASLTATAQASISRSINFAYSPTGGFEWALTPFDIDIQANLMAALTLRAWTEGWFCNKALEWTFLEFPIAHLVGTKLVLEVGASGNQAAGVRFKSTKPGTFGWGAPPEPVESAGRPVR